MARPDELETFAVVVQAPAKINLALHVTGQRADGYHLLESLVTFTDFGDRVGISPSEEDRFTLSGPFAGGLSADGDNLVVRARDALRDTLRSAGVAAGPVHIHLEKNLPIASGIGGGSADAAAALRGLLSLWQAVPDRAALDGIVIALGADVPMCLNGRPLIARGIGEHIETVALPALPIVLVNPLVGVSTPAVFRGLARKDNPPLGLDGASDDWFAAITRLRNDLEPPARALCPEIGHVAAALAATGASLVRMSGSGATCFALYPSDTAAKAAVEQLLQSHPSWFIIATTTTGASHGTA